MSNLAIFCVGKTRKQEITSSRCCSGLTLGLSKENRHMSHWGPVILLQSRRHEFEPKHRHISSVVIGQEINSTAILSLYQFKKGSLFLWQIDAVLWKQMLQSLSVTTGWKSKNTHKQIYFASTWREVLRYIGVNVLLHLVRPRCIFTHACKYTHV